MPRGGGGPCSPAIRAHPGEICYPGRQLLNRLSTDRILIAGHGCGWDEQGGWASEAPCMGQGGPPGTARAPGTASGQGAGHRFSRPATDVDSHAPNPHAPYHSHRLRPKHASPRLGDGGAPWGGTTASVGPAIYAPSPPGTMKEGPARSSTVNPPLVRAAFTPYLPVLPGQHHVYRGVHPDPAGEPLPVPRSRVPDQTGTFQRLGASPCATRRSELPDRLNHIHHLPPLPPTSTSSQLLHLLPHQLG